MASLRPCFLPLLLYLLVGLWQGEAHELPSAAVGPHGLRAGAAAQRRLLAEPSTVASAVQKYLDNEELDVRLHEYARRCASLAKLHVLGKSVEGRPIWALELSDKPGKAEAEPNVKYIGNVHGDEPTGRVLTLALAEWLCASYKRDVAATRLIDRLHLWLVPTLNPDGFAARTRENKNKKDLNRDFPDRFEDPGMKASGKEQPETRAMMDWSLKHRFTASAAMHEGALVANYPWDGTEDRSTGYRACPDDATFRSLATLYATSHRSMARPSNPEFPGGGITNGAAWYPIYGSMQDWSYIVGEAMEITLELSQDKWPDEALLPGLWEDNKPALLAFAWQAAYGGVWGVVREARGKLRAGKGQEGRPVGGANITIAGINKHVHTGARFGDFYRPLAPGDYKVIVSVPGYKPATADITVPADGSGVQQNFFLQPLPGGKGGVSASATKNAAVRTAHGQTAHEEAEQQDEAAGEHVWRGGRKQPRLLVVLLVCMALLASIWLAVQVQRLTRRLRRRRQQP